MHRFLLVGLTLALGACATTSPPALRSDTHPSTAGTGVPLAAAREPASVMVRAATAMLGQPYRYGGAAPGGFDCSGLVAYAAGTAGLHVPRTAHEQMRVGSAVERHAVRAGDLVFMHLARKELHVGIAIDADRFIHAPSTGGTVRIDSLTRRPYSRGFIDARRVVGDTVSH